MIVDQRFAAYIHSLEKENPAYLEELEQEALRTHVPIIKKEMQSFLKTLLVLTEPKKILEVGTAIGFSALLMSEYTPPDTCITTIENYDKRVQLARANFKKYKKENRITLLEGDAAVLLPELQGTFDFIFMDAAKGQYIHFLPEVLRLLSVGGLLLSDNVLQDGEIFEPREAVMRRNRTIHSRMRAYLRVLKEQEELETTILCMGDGVTLSVRKEAAESIQ